MIAARNLFTTHREASYVFSLCNLLHLLHVHLRHESPTHALDAHCVSADDPHHVVRSILLVGRPVVGGVVLG